MIIIKSLLAINLIVFASAKNFYKDESQHSLKSDANQSKLYFPEHATSKNNRASHNRSPVEDHVRCGINEFLHPGDHANDWTCDCKPGFIYSPNDDACYEAYRRGPCRDGEIFKIVPPFKSAKCVLNECRRDGFVLFNGKCQQLDSVNACRQFQYLIGRKTYLTVNFSTLELTCADYEHTYECIGICCDSFNGTRECFQKRY
ncbi:hypothetical protein PVAND_001189 [Polypedilum vanderplanki]|uniref:DUF4789 domain-containing protein n=1 Tax=Polypedilum vanderplanki TaxID=319348 RepID=A0A9J6BMK8_POLVA|nr:hypothetical protein PVAND_001189 [Polypedilum vanderplanki]